ncbi:sensor domain-containing diguanylate cyclase [Thiohalophilus thiocyanatoxydans]|uniref:diguanylate cyclase n=1 Tax=Thiohalophilus thiocyanatoxydans TaxID=381308 RepID=A0A4R8IJ29_9GAMM|nr:sensor domain-containing diguanylate cyclase [Thiohalophilus thiocyanatoxydans]TDY00034.1 diguanylate cyclase [Thiohalophilus thiocyanatoxydans]
MQYKKPYFTAALVALLVLGFLATSIVSYLIAHDSVRNQIAEEALPLTSDNIYSEIERDLLRSILISSLMAHDTFVLDWTLDGEKEPEKIIRYLKQIQQRYDTTTAFFVSEQHRKYYHPTGVLKTLSRDDPADKWYFRVRQMNDPYEINLDFDTADRDRLSIFVNYQVTDYNGKFIGVTGIGLSVKRVADLIENYQQRYSREVYFVDREGKVTVRGSGYTGAERLQDRAGMDRVATHILANPSSSVNYTRPDGKTVFVNSRLVPEFDWHLIVEQAESSADSRILDALFANIIIALMITALVVTIIWFTFRRYQRRLEEMATTDKLTGAANRHVFEIIFNHDISSARRNNTPVTLISLDIDNFKAMNDTHGHDCGDTILYNFTELVRGHIRASDTLCRWGGDEFVILLNDCNAENAIRRAETIREAISRYPFRCGKVNLDMSISVGLAEYAPGETLPDLIKRADTALYTSKKQGRNRITIA